MLKLTKSIGIVASASLVLLAVYVLSIVWRVSVAQHEIFGKSLLIRAWGEERQFSEPPVLGSFGSVTYSLNYGGIAIKVWPEKINGYQHTFGSALASYEVGDFLADKLFCANEFAEWTFDKNGISLTDLLDRRRDLANNRVGRRIGSQARALGLSGAAAERYMRLQVLKEMEFDGTVIVHPYEKKSLELCSESALGCPHLPRRNIFDVAMKCSRRLERAAQRFRRHFIPVA